MFVWFTQDQVYGGLVLFVMIAAAAVIAWSDRPRRDDDEGGET